jgi:class 3 adenylate cyclase/putative methionine-R-sulfoxide reductase with GAF domain
MLQLVEKTVKLMNSSFRDDELMGTVMQELNSVVAIDAAVILVKDENLPGAVKVWKRFGHSSASLLKHSEYRCQGSLVEKALQQDLPLIFDIPRERTSPLDRDLFPADSPGCCFVAPLRTGGRVFGAFVLTSSSRESLVDARDLLAWVAGGLALAIDRRRLQAGVQKRDQEMETIRQIGSALASSTFDIGKVLNYTMDMVREVLNVEAGSLLFVEDRVLEVAVSFNVRLPDTEKFRLNMGQGIAGNVAARGEAVIVNDTGASPHFFRGIDDATGFRTRTVLCVPMISQSRVIGVIEVLNKVDGRFNENDRELLQAIAASVCIAIENSRLYKETVAAAEHERNVRRSFQKFVPKEVVDQIIHGAEGSPPVIEELRQVTLLNVDIRGFSRMARQIGPRRTVTLLNRFFAAMGGVVFHHNGIVDKYLGDGFLAVFGAPIATGEHADNALRAAIEMKRSLGRVNGLLGGESGMPVDMGISIHTGEVLAGSVGFEKKVDYTVIGDAVNTVFRLQAVAKSFPNGILASESTMDAARERPPARQVGVPPGFRQELGALMVYELIDHGEVARPLRTA